MCYRVFGADELIARIDLLESRSGFSPDEFAGAVEKLKRAPLGTIADHVDILESSRGLESSREKLYTLGMTDEARAAARVPPREPTPLDERAAATQDVERQRGRLAVIDGTSAWPAKTLAEMRVRFEQAVETDDWIVVFSAKLRGTKLVVNANADTRDPPLVPWFAMLGFMQARLNDWMREHMGG